jgi:hypothetical protein
MIFLVHQLLTTDADASDLSTATLAACHLLTIETNASSLIKVYLAARHLSHVGTNSLVVLPAADLAVHLLLQLGAHHLIVLRFLLIVRVLH